MKSIKLFDSLYKLIGIPTLFMIAVTSRGFTEIKIGLLLVLAIVSFLELSVTRKGVNRGFFIYICIFITYMMGSLLWGIVNGYEFSLSKDEPLLRYYLTTPFLLLLYSTIYTNRYDRLAYTISVLRHITLYIVIGDLYKILSLRIVLPDLDPIGLFTFTNVNYEDAILRISNETQLMYLLPLYIVLLFENKGIKAKVEKAECWVIVIGGLLYCILSGRKMLEFVVFATLFFMVVRDMVKRYSVHKIKRIMLVLTGATVFILLINRFSSILKITNIFDTAINTFTAGLSRNDYGVTKRANDIKNLFSMFLDSPIIGNGLNSYVEGRQSAHNNWSYEVYFNALLAQTGIAGIGIFGFGIYFLVSRLQRFYKQNRNPMFFAFNVGFVSFLACAATNPIINDMLPWFFTMAIVFAYINNFR